MCDEQGIGRRGGGGCASAIPAMVVVVAATLAASAHGHPWITSTAPTVIAIASRPHPLTPMDAIDSARIDLLGAVARARRGELTQQALRLARLAIEARLALVVAGMETDLRPGEFAALGSARSRLNQAIIRSQEWEAFGPNDRPEWGWYPSREIESAEGSVVAGLSE